MNKDKFKEFVQKHPELADYIIDGTMTWQKFYELYDLYGENSEIWDKYKKNNKSKTQATKLTDLIKNINTDSIEKNLETAQKALDVFSELTTKTSENITNTVKPNVIRPITKFFGD